MQIRLAKDMPGFVCSYILFLYKHLLLYCSVFSTQEAKTSFKSRDGGEGRGNEGFPKDWPVGAKKTLGVHK